MKNDRYTAGKFSVGNSGRPWGSRNKATLAIESLLKGQAEAGKQKALLQAILARPLLSLASSSLVISFKILQTQQFNKLAG